MTLPPPRLSRAARDIAKQIVSDELDPYDGAMKIWKQVIDQLDNPIPDELWPFKSNASAIEDCLWNARESGVDHDELIAQCKQEIVQAARALVGDGGGLMHSPTGRRITPP